MADTPARDFLAIVLIGAGSTFARGPDMLKVQNDVLARAKRDWGGIYALDGEKVKINLFEVTGHDKVHWDHQGVHGDADTPIEKLIVIDTVFPASRKRK